MYTIIMRDNKVLETTVKTSLYQREKLVDKIQFLFPQTYGDLNISECTAILKYEDQIGVAHAEILKLEDELHKDMLRFVLPVDTKLTEYAGDIKIRITLTKTDLETNTQFVLHTSQTTITIQEMEDYFHFSPDKSLEFIDQLVGKIDAKVQFVQDTVSFLNENKADDLVRVDDADGPKIQLTSEGNPIGNPVSIDHEEITSVSFADEFPDDSEQDTDVTNPDQTGEGTTYNLTKIVDEDGTKVQLTYNGEPIGDPISIEQEEIRSVSFEDEYANETS